MIYKLERKYGKYAIKRLSLYIVGAYILGYILQMVAPNALFLLSLDPYQIIHGQIWRLVTWAIMPPYSLSIFTVINLFFIYSIGATMENIWGTFRFNVYIFGGMFCCIIGAFVLYGIEALTGVFASEMIGGLSRFSYMLSLYFTTYYINISMIMAFAMSIPDAMVMLYFIIPIKMKYFAYIEIFFIAIDLITGNTLKRCVIILSLINFIVFYLSGRKARTYGGTAFYKKKTNSSFERATYQKKTTIKPSTNKVTRHKCAICGRTEETNPELEFRFCSKCFGNYEYCSDHLFTHTHVQ